MWAAHQKLPKQFEKDTGGHMNTSEKTLTQYGIATLAVVREGFLTPEHNKAGCAPSPRRTGDDRAM